MYKNQLNRVFPKKVATTSAGKLAQQLAQSASLSQKKRPNRAG